MKTLVKNKRIDEDRFLKRREKILSLWPTGKEVNLEEAIEYQRSLPESKRFSKVLEKLHNEGKTVIFPRAGTGLLEEMIELVRSLAKNGVPLMPVTIDSHTRIGQFDKVQRALEESVKTGRNLLNGYPIVNHGVKNTRKLVESCDAAFSPRGYGNLGLEIGIASGMTGVGPGLFLGFGSYRKKETLEECIGPNQYITRLMGYYADRGVILTADIHGLLPCGIFPLSVNIVCLIVEALIAVEQGVKSLMPQIHFEGNMAQDLAWIRVTQRLLREYLDKSDYRNVELSGTCANQIPLFPVPQGMGEAFGYLNYTAMVAALAKVETVFLRTIDEGAGVPTAEAHALSYKSGNWILEVVRPQNIQMEMKEIEIEERITELEVRAILERLFEMGEGDIIMGSIKGIEAGIIDSPFSPSVNLKGKVLGIKDAKGACRYLDMGNLPIPKEAQEFHREKLAERERVEKRKMDYNVSIEDFWAFSKGKLLGMPSSH